MKKEMKNEAAEGKIEADKTNPEEFSLDIKYNGELMSLDKQKATELAQKGMNYDHVYEELKRLREDPELEKLERLSRTAGMSKGELLDLLLTEDETNPDMVNEQSAQEQAMGRLVEFFKSHPQLAGKDGLPEEVKQEVLSGGDIEDAYLKYENRLLRGRLAEMENVGKSPGALHTEGAGSGEDAFARMLLARL